MKNFTYSKYLLIFSFLLVGCKQLGNYKPIPGVDDKINALCKEIASIQRDEVWTGGNENTGCYMWTDYESFQKRGGAEKIVFKAKENKIFKDGVFVLKKLYVEKLIELIDSWNKPIDPTWSETGEIGNGTTDAGRKAETEIALALTNLLRDLLK